MGIKFRFLWIILLSFLSRDLLDPFTEVIKLSDGGLIDWILCT